MRPARAGERWVILFLLAALLFSPPLLSIFSGHRLLSVPVIYLYLFLSWGLVIFLLALAAEGSFPQPEVGRSTPADEPSSATPARPHAGSGRED